MILLQGAPECMLDMQKIWQVCKVTGVPIESKKSDGSATTLQFLGLELDTVALEVHMLKAKLEALRAALADWRDRKACKKRELLSLIGSLSFACRPVRAGRTFLRRRFPQQILSWTSLRFPVGSSRH